MGFIELEDLDLSVSRVSLSNLELLFFLQIITHIALLSSHGWLRPNKENEYISAL